MDYIPSWITGAKTLLEKINKCIDKIEEYLTITDSNTQGIETLNEVVVQHATDIATNAENISNLNSDVNVLESSKQDALTPGEGISIVNNVISATGGSEGSIYAHKLYLRMLKDGSAFTNVSILLYFAQSTVLTKDDIKTFFYKFRYYAIPAISGGVTLNDATGYTVGFSYEGNGTTDNFNLYVLNSNGAFVSQCILDTVTDTVIQV